MDSSPARPNRTLVSLPITSVQKSKMYNYAGKRNFRAKIFKEEKS